MTVKLVYEGAHRDGIINGVIRIYIYRAYASP